MQACVWKLKCEFHWLDCEYKFIKLETVCSVFIGWIGLNALDFEDWTGSDFNVGSGLWDTSWNGLYCRWILKKKIVYVRNTE